MPMIPKLTVGSLVPWGNISGKYQKGNHMQMLSISVHLSDSLLGAIPVTLEVNWN